MRIAVGMVGIGLLLYPVIGGKINQAHQTKVVKEYQLAESNLTEEKKKELQSSAREFNADLYEFNRGKIGLLSETLSKRYYEEMKVEGTEAMGYISIPKLDVQLPIMHGTEEKTLQKSCGHMEGTSLPVGGESSHCVLAAHRGLPSARLFTDLDQMVEKDMFYIYINGETLAYEVFDVVTVLPDDVSILEIIKGEDHVTLMTCTPYGINSHRLLVRGTRVPYDPAKEEEIKSTRTVTASVAIAWILAAITVDAFLIMVMVIPRYYQRQSRLEAKRKRSKFDA